MNNLCATGRLGKDCETRFTSSGDAITAFTFALESGYGDKKVTTWLNCAFFGKRGEAVAPYLKKGTQVAISGELTNREYTDKDGNKRYSLDLRVSDLTLIGGKPAEDKTSPAQRVDRGGEMEDDIPFDI